MRALITGIIGAAASSAGWLAFEHSQQQNYGWLVCLVGLITGVGVNAGASSAKGGTLRGALAVLLTLAGIVGGQKGYATWMQNNSRADEAVSIESIDMGPEDNAEDSEDGETTEAPAEEPPKIEIPEVNVVGGQANYSRSKNYSEWDMVWMSIAALAAYITGKGGEKSKSEPASEEPAREPATDEADSNDSLSDDSALVFVRFARLS